jgi:hypothetical protein
MRTDAPVPTTRDFNHGRTPLLDAEATTLASGRTQNANENCNHPAEGPPIGENPECHIAVRFLSGGVGTALDRRRG